MKRKNLKNMLVTVTTAAMALTLLVGCGGNQAKKDAQSENKTAGIVLLSVNPEIEIEYDNGGLVLEVEGANDDGKSVVKKDAEYKGKDCREVVNALVKEIYEAGYFDETVDGHTKNIVLKLEEGSAYPDEDFLKNIADGVREAVKEYNLSSNPMMVDEDDLDEKGRIGEKRAKQLLLAQLGLKSASFNNHEYDLDDGVYEFEFSIDGVEYEYEVDANTGKILEADIDGNDDWDDQDDWDDWDEFDDMDDDDIDDDDIDDNDDTDDNDDDDIDDDQDDNTVSIPVNGDDDDNDDWDDDQNDDWDDDQNDDWDDDQNDDWNDDQNDDWDDDQNDDWNDDQNDDWDDDQDNDGDDDQDDDDQDDDDQDDGDDQDDND